MEKLQNSAESFFVSMKRHAISGTTPTAQEHECRTVVAGKLLIRKKSGTYCMTIKGRSWTTSQLLYVINICS